MPFNDYRMDVNVIWRLLNEKSGRMSYGLLNEKSDQSDARNFNIDSDVPK